MGCLNCGMGLHELCETCKCCAPQTSPGNPSSVSPDSSDDGFGDIEGAKASQDLVSDIGGIRIPGKRASKPDSDLKDPESTGRKRAALLYPIIKTDPCEWKGLANCGGGKFPIVGCFDGKQANIHHGPDKNTLNNSRDNISLICEPCHNIWHSQNDPVYDSANPGKLSETRPATNIELAMRYGRVYKTKQGDAVNKES